ncbi:MAG: hypothetical protein ABI548_22610 [Polyangiaceae bacterium]
MQIKGMIQVQSITYRIVRMEKGTYQVVRLLDDASVGTFSLVAHAEPVCQGEHPELIREIARAALQGARTTWAPRRLSSPFHPKAAH